MDREELQENAQRNPEIKIEKKNYNGPVTIEPLN